MACREMAFTIPEKEPVRIYAGDRLQWKRTDLSDFPATTWTLTYYLRSNIPSAGQIDIVAAADGSDFEVDVDPTVSSEYVPGVYYWSGFVSSSGDRKLVAQGRLEILQNPTEITSPVDGRSQNRRILEAVEATIARRASSDMQRYVFQAIGRSVDKEPLADLLKLRDYYASLVKQEDDPTTARGKNVFVRFNL